MVILGVCAAVLIGVSLGMLGSGGSILTVSTIHYLFGIEPHAAIASSMLVVGATSLVALIPHARAGHVRTRIGMIFGGASMLGAYAAGRASVYVPPRALLFGLAGVMIVAAIAMLRPRIERTRTSSMRLVAHGFVVGAITGFVGAGGGFVIVPALVAIVGLSITEAIGTSLLVIVMSSFTAFGATAGTVTLDGYIVGIVLAAATLGALLGGSLAHRVPATRLRQWFGWFVLAMAIVIAAAEGLGR